MRDERYLEILRDWLDDFLDVNDYVEFEDVRDLLNATDTKDFLNIEGASIRTFIKMLFADIGTSAQMCLLKWLLGDTVRFKEFATQNLKMNAGVAVCDVRVMNGFSENIYAISETMGSDIDSWMIKYMERFSRYLVISELYSIKRGAGKNLIEMLKLCNVPIILKIDIPLSYQNINSDREIADLMRYFESLGFKQVSVRGLSDNIYMLWDCGEISRVRSFE